MAKYKMIETVVEAVPYDFGIEDGFILYNNEYVPADGQSYPEDFRSTKYPRYIRAHEHIIDTIMDGSDLGWRPYIKDYNGEYQPLNSGDMIIIGPNSKKTICKAAEFEETYKLVKENNIDKYEFAIKAIENNYPPASYTMLREGLDTTIKLLKEEIEKERKIWG